MANCVQSVSVRKGAGFHQEEAISGCFSHIMEAHTLSHTATRLKGDKKVNLALDNRLERESVYRRKKSITVESEATFRSAFGLNTVQGEIPGTTPEAVLTLSEEGVPSLTLPVDTEDLRPTESFMKEVKLDAKTKCLVKENERILEHVQTLMQQGKYLEMTKLQGTDATWQGFIYNLPRGTMKWVLNSSINTLPTKTNLKQWGKLVNDKCFCRQRQTLNHILSCCVPSLEQGRFTFRHDNILHYISECLDRQRFKCFLDLEGQQTEAGGTIPTSLVITVKKPDIVIINQKTKSAHIFELTVPGEARLDTAHKLKTESYSHFVTDIRTHSVTVTPFEVGAHTGHINNDNKTRLHMLHSYCKKEIKLKKFKENISALAILGSYYIFNCRNQETWSTPDYILAPFPNQ